MGSVKRTIPALFALILAAAAPAPLSAQSERPPAPASDLPFKASSPSAPKSVEIGDYYFRKRDYPGAISRYREAMKTDPNYAPAYLGEAKCYDRTGLDKLALADYKKYLDLLPSTKEAEKAHAVHAAIDRLELRLAQQTRTSASSK